MHRSSDIIIIGAGNAGCAAAKLLAKEYSVTLLEAGFDQSDDYNITTPSQSGGLVLNDTNRYFAQLGHALPQPGLPNRFPAPAGEIVGGSSSLNGMQYVEGTSRFYDELGQLLQDPDWAADNVKKVFKRIQTFNGFADYNPAAHGFDGPVDVKQVVINEQAAALFSATVSAVESIPQDIDYNDFATPIGSFKYWQVTQTPDSKRESSFTAYLKQNLVQSKSNPNLYRATDTRHPLQLIVRANFQKLIFEDCGKPRAVGVTVSINGKCVDFTACKYVILATGFQTSGLLQYSGIGDAKKLKSLGITPLVNNPNVGQHLINHPIITSTGLVDPAGVNPFTPLPPGYDTQGLYSGGAVLAGPTGVREFQMIGITSPNVAGQAPSAFTIASLILKAESRGEINIFDQDVNRVPLYEFNYMTEPSDVERGVDIYTRQFRVLTAMGLIPQGPNPDTDPAGVINYVKTRFSQAYHWVGMNRMSTSPKAGVVTSAGRVFGTKNLYVADISIMPTNPEGNTQSIAYLVGNIIAHKLLRKNKKCGCSHSSH
jgi:choline dehydrogenase